MKVFANLLILLSIYCGSYAQDNVAVISPAAHKGQVYLPELEGWKFQSGHDTVWSAIDLNDSNWEKINPQELSVDMVDKNGRLEGWFRLKFSISDEFENKGWWLDYAGWAAAEIYLDGKLFKVYGNTGNNGSHFQEFNSTHLMPDTINLLAGKTHLLAIHFVDYKVLFPRKMLKSEYSGLKYFVTLLKPEFVKKYENIISKDTLFSTLWVTALVLLCFLFWTLLFLNKKEKVLMYVSLFISLFTIGIFFMNLSTGIGITYYQSVLYDWGSEIFIFAAFLFAPFLLAGVFQIKIQGYFKKSAVLLFCLYIVSKWILPAISFLLVGPSVIAIIYMLIKFRKKIGGNERIIVAGIIVSFSTLLLISILAATIYKDSFNPYFLELLSVSMLSLPVALLVYIAFRFKAINAEVELKAAKIVEMTEAKRQEALDQQKILEEQVKERTSQLSQSLENLKATQSQLIQSEKMASLGELTAGIAHEIQNPLNFVNNFSELSNELLEEMNEEMAKGDLEEAKVIAKDIKQNLEKINHHGKRADAIVKGMLQHSRKTTATKELTDINKLADEYLRLAYHGFRAKDKLFNATLHTNFDPTLEPIFVIPQDIGRVLLNLITNAFYACTERSRSAIAEPGRSTVNEKILQNPNGYEPAVTVTTKNHGDHILITVKDNGKGIPSAVSDKIFQPFFTTKPTGEGTGLGLSLSYDIIKVHSGKLEVETLSAEETVQKDSYTIFKITLPKK